jgi:hypothetical protein
MQPVNDSSIESFIRLLAITLFSALPLILVCSIGIVVCIMRRGRHPSVCLLTSVGLGLMLLNRIALGTLTMWLPSYLQTQGWKLLDAGLVNGGFVFFSSTVGAVALALVVCAVFSGRERIYWEREKKEISE